MDLDMSVLVDRGTLGLAALEINDGVRYKVGDQFLGATVAWNPQRVGSPWMDGEVTTGRSRAMVAETVTAEVFGRAAPGDIMTNAVLQANMTELVTAFLQDSFTVTVTIDTDTIYQYACEAADFGLTWTGGRFRARQGKVTLQVPRQPRALVGI